MVRRKLPRNAKIALAALILMSGCDERVVEVAREAADRQAVQNQQMGQLQMEVAAGTRSLVEADAAARQEIVGVHRDLQAERQQLGKSWRDLEVQRRKLVQDRRTESVIAPLISAFAGLALVIVLLSFLQRLLSLSQSTDATGVEFQELLVEQLLTRDMRTLDGQEPENATRDILPRPDSVSLPPLPRLISKRQQ